VLVIGDEAWPVPIPIVRTGDRWRFATEGGADEIVNRRIGGNERNAIYVLRAYLDAQREYAAVDRDGDEVLQYAQKVASSTGKHDGLTGPPIPRRARSRARLGHCSPTLPPISRVTPRAIPIAAITFVS